MELPKAFTIREQNHRIHNAFTLEKTKILGEAIGVTAGNTILDLACGSGEMVCTWGRDHGTIATGVDISSVFIQRARARAEEFGVAGRVEFVHGDAAGHVATEPVDIVACLGATWIGRGVPGTLTLMEKSLRPDGLLLVGEPFWRSDTPDAITMRGCGVSRRDMVKPLPDLVGQFGELGWDLVEMVLADEDAWDRYIAAQWLNVRRWLKENPDDELAGRLRADLDVAPQRYVRYQRPHLGWGVFVLMRR